MNELRVNEELWGSNMVQEGTVERWFVADAAQVQPGEKLLELRIDDACHEIMATASGTLHIAAKANSVVEPGSLLAEIN